MDFSSSELSSMVFKRVVRQDIGEFPLNHQMLSVFMALDGKAPLGAVARKTGLNMSRFFRLSGGSSIACRWPDCPGTDRR
jgi:hypothetical protein